MSLRDTFFAKGGRETDKGRGSLSGVFDDIQSVAEGKGIPGHPKAELQDNTVHDTDASSSLDDVDVFGDDGPQVDDTVGKDAEPWSAEDGMVDPFDVNAAGTPQPLPEPGAAAIDDVGPVMPSPTELRQAVKETRQFETASGQTRALSAKQERFCELVAGGAKLADAYREAYDASRSTPETVYQSASRLNREPHIAARIEALRAAEKGRVYHDGAYVRRYLVDQLMERVEKSEKDSDKIKALQLLGEFVHVKAFSKQTETLTKHDFTGLSSSEMRAELSKLLGKKR